MSTSKSNVSAPAELLAKREHLIAELDKAAKSAHGTLQQVLLKMGVLIGGTRPGAAIDPQGCEGIKEAFLRFSEDPAAPRTPPILMEAMEWIQAYLAASSSLMAAPAPAGVRASPSPATSAAPRGKDSFESGAAPRARSVTGEVPHQPAAPPAEAPKGQQQQLESFKTWMKNPALGKLKG
jgi:hypothetical protein